MYYRVFLAVCCTITFMCYNVSYGISRKQVKISGVNLSTERQENFDVYSINEKPEGDYKIRSEGRVGYHAKLNVPNIIYSSGIEHLDNKHFDSLYVDKLGAEIQTYGQTYQAAILKVSYKLSTLSFKDIKTLQQLEDLKEVVRQAQSYFNNFSSTYRSQAHLVEQVIEFDTNVVDINHASILLQHLPDLVSQIEMELEQREKEREEFRRDSILQIRIEPYMRSYVILSEVDSNTYMSIVREIGDKIAQLMLQNINETSPKGAILNIGIKINPQGEKEISIEGFEGLHEQVRDIIYDSSLCPYEITYQDIDRTSSLPTLVDLSYEISQKFNVSGMCRLSAYAKWYEPILWVFAPLGFTPSLEPKRVKYIKPKNNLLRDLPEEKKPQIKDLQKGVTIYTYQCVEVGGKTYEQRLYEPLKNE